jgi:hypothetical protein
MRTRRRTWWELGIVALGLFLVCGTVRAQEAGVGSQGSLDAQVPVQAPGQAGAGTVAGGTGGSGQSAPRQEVERLRAQVARLQLQLAQVRRQLAEAQAGQGVGGAGPVGIGDPAAEAPVGATGLGDPNAEGVGGGGRAGQPDTDDQGTALVSAIYSGKLRSITGQQLVLEGEQGEAPSRHALGRNVRVLRNGREVSLKSLKQGTLIRISSDITAPGNPVTEIQVLERAR